jgi:hypothetical protein
MIVAKKYIGMNSLKYSEIRKCTSVSTIFTLFLPYKKNHLSRKGGMHILYTALLYYIFPRI